MGIGLIRSVRASGARPLVGSGPRMLGAFYGGLLLTLGDLKAIFLYASLFPLCIDLTTLTASGVAWVILLTAFSVGSVKVAYALFAHRIVSRFASAKLQKGSRIAAGTVLIGAGGLVIAKT